MANEEHLLAGAAVAQRGVSAGVPSRVAGPPPAADRERDAAVVLTMLEPDQIVAAKRSRFCLCRVSPGLGGGLWGLRSYVVFMLAVVTIEVVRGLTGHG